MNRSIAALGLALCLAACASTSERAPARVDITHQVNALLEQAYPANGPGGAVLIARGDTILFRAARGEADIETHTALRSDSIFRIGSVTKQFTAAGVLSLVEAGRVDLDAPLSTYLPDFPRGEQITVRQVLNHTSGVRNYSSLPNFAERIIREDHTTAQLIDLFKNEPADFEPGSNWSYSNSGYVLAAAIIESVTGMTWHDYLRQTFFEPLGMAHTGYGHDPRFTQVHGYAYNGEAIVPSLPLSMTAPHGAGALVSTIDDLLTWNRALHEGRILSNETYTQMITPTGAATQPGARYGFGIEQDSIRDHAVLRHGGHIFGFMATLLYIPGPDISVVILENDDARNTPLEVDTLARRLAAIALGQPYPAVSPVSIEPAALAAAEGVYRFDGDFTRVLRMVDGALTSQRGAGERRALTPIAADDFLYPDGFNRLQLERDASGAIIAARFFANGDGAGERGLRSNEPLPEAPTGLSLPRATLERLVGDYANSEVSLRVFLDGDTLKAAIPDQPAFALLASSPLEFEVEGESATATFAAGDTPAASVTILQGGRTTTLQRQ